jgi:hypothetical protein
MAGLLDFLNTPESRLGIGLLAAAGPRADGAGFGQRLNEAMGMQDAYGQRKEQSDWLRMERERKQKEWGLQDKENALAGQFFKPATAGLSPLSGDSASGILPSTGSPGTPAAFDMAGYAQAMMQVNPARGLQFMQFMQKNLPVDKISPEKFTPASLAKFAQTRNFGDLVPRDKLEFVEGVGVNPYDSANANRAIPNPNKPFAMDASGNIVPNRAYQDYEIRKAGAGATRVSNNVAVNTEKSFLNEIAGGLGKQIEASTGQARAASDSLRTIRQLSDILNSGKVMAGPATKPAMLLTQLGSQLGLAGKDANETLQKTRAAMQQMAQLELDAAAQMKGQGQITENERDIIRRAASGDISMTLPELKTLTASLDKTARYRIERHNKNVQPLIANPNAAALAPFLTVPEPQASQPAGGGVVDFGSLK